MKWKQNLGNKYLKNWMETNNEDRIICEVRQMDGDGDDIIY